MVTRRRSAAAVPKDQTPALAPRRSMEISSAALSRLGMMAADAKPAIDPFRLPVHPPGVAAERGMAQDDALNGNLSWASGQFAGLGLQGVGFFGWARLAELSQRPEYRRIVETIAEEMTRRWIRITAKGDQDKSERVAELDGTQRRMGLQKHFRAAVVGDGFMGRGHLFLDFGEVAGDELKSDIGDGADRTSRAKVGPDRPLKAVRAVEAMWCSPLGYDTSNPLSPCWYRPRAWSVQGKEIHASRLLTFVGREVPDILKPTYSFGGLSLTQLAEPYVSNWLRTRQGVSDLIVAFSVSGLKTDLADAVNSGAAFDNLLKRVAVFNSTRTNLGTMILDKDEDFFNVQTGLGTLDKLQAQAQEQCASIVKIPLVKYTGLQPSGLNATSQGELDSFHDDIRAAQEHEIRPNLQKVLDLTMLSLWGEIDPDIGFEFEHLDEMDEKERAELQEIRARTGETLVRSRAVSQAEERARVANDYGTPYQGLDLDKAVPLPETERVEIGTKVAATVIAAHEAALTTDAVALKGLAATGIMPEITPEVIAQADQDPPAPEGEEGEADDPVPNPLRDVERAGRLTFGGEVEA